MSDTGTVRWSLFRRPKNLPPTQTRYFLDPTLLQTTKDSAGIVTSLLHVQAVKFIVGLYSALALLRYSELSRGLQNWNWHHCSWNSRNSRVSELSPCVSVWRSQALTTPMNTENYSSPFSLLLQGQAGAFDEI